MALKTRLCLVEGFINFGMTTVPLWGTLIHIDTVLLANTLKNDNNKKCCPLTLSAAAFSSHVTNRTPSSLKMRTVSSKICSVGTTFLDCSSMYLSTNLNGDQHFTSLIHSEMDSLKKFLKYEKITQQKAGQRSQNKQQFWVGLVKHWGPESKQYRRQKQKFGFVARWDEVLR